MIWIVRRFVFVFASLLLAMPIALAAQDAPLPSPLPLEEALNTTPIPVRDRVDLARRLLGVTDIPEPPTSAFGYRAGAQEMFYVTDTTNNRIVSVQATLRVVGEHIYLWVQSDQGDSISDNDLQALADEWDDFIYQGVRDLWGEEDSPGIDGDPRIYALFTDQTGASVAAYFASDNTLPRAVVSTSNEHEMFLFNLDTFDYYTPSEIQSVFAHEFQHMVRDNLQENEETWMNEGFSEFTQAYLYNEQSYAIYDFLFEPDTQLNGWAEESFERGRNYGASNLFLIYFFERYGLDAIRTLSGDSAPRGLQSVDNVLQAMGEPGVDVLFADWVAANITGDYDRLEIGLDTTVYETVYPFDALTLDSTVRQYGTDYYDISSLEGDSITFTVETPELVGVIPVAAPSGEHFWYSNRADMSDTMLTRAFDLTDVTSAAIEYKVWFHFEDEWDYGYLMVSTDGGATWTPLETSNTTTRNPHNTAYGAGYTGTSGGGSDAVWLNERVSLDAYVGQEILLRFETITDDAVNQPGMAIDDIKLAALNYSATFETDDGGWDSAGWIWTNNRMPQRAWVQVIEQLRNETHITRWLIPDDGRTFTMQRDPDADITFLAISALAPVTTVPMPYTITFEPGD